MTTTIGTIELVLFKVNEGLSDDEVLKAATALNECVKIEQGFIRRRFAKSEEQNLWMDLVLWTDMESAQKAAKNVMKNETAQHFFSMINESSMQFIHFEPRFEFE